MKRVPRIAITSACVGCILLYSGCAAERPAARTHGDIVLVTVDTLRPDHLGVYGYARATSSHLDRLFEHGLVYERAYSAEANTPPSVVSFLSGLPPQEHRVRLFYQQLAPEIPLVSELLPETYQTAAFVSNMVLTDEALGIAGRFDHYDDNVDEREPYRPVYERNATRTTDAAIAWLADSRDPDRPLFLWVHYIDPHGPYRPPADWKRSFTHTEPRIIDVERVPRYGREPGVADGFAYRDSYDEEIAYTDAQLRRLIEAYEADASLADALLLFTADHGESMMEHEKWFTHGYHTYEEIVRVPLMLRGSGVTPGRTSKLAAGIDVATTILRAAGTEPPSALRGADLRHPERLPADRLVFTEATNAERQWRAAIGASKKWMLSLAGPQRSIVARRVYDLAVDPYELQPRVWSEDAGVAANALVELARADPDPSGIPTRYRRGIKLSAPKVAPGVDPKTLERLRGLGYAD